MSSNRFALGTFDRGGSTFVGLVVAGRVLDLNPFSDRLECASDKPTLQHLLERWNDVLPELEAFAGTTDGWVEEKQLQTHAPFLPRQIFQSGANYRKHVIDLHMAHPEAWNSDDPDEARAHVAALMEDRAARGTPYIFLGLPSAVTGPYDDVVLPGYSEMHDWELELAAVIGGHGYQVDQAQALDLVAGYTIVNDITTRDLVFRRDMREMGTDWFRSKNAPGFLPMGPYMVPAQFIDDPMDLRIQLELNGEMMQDESTSDMIFDVASLVAAVTQITPVAPGDLVLTGSPAGNGMAHGRLLRHGDVMRGSIAGLGTQVTRTISSNHRR